jgi:hypothetical protein
MSAREHKIKRIHDGGTIRLSCSCGHAFNTDSKVWAAQWEQFHLLGKVKTGRKRQHEAETP